MNGLYDEVRPDKPRTIDDEQLAQLIHKTLHTKPADGSTHRSVRTIAAETAILPTSVHRYFKLLELQPHRQRLTTTVVDDGENRHQSGAHRLRAELLGW
ncbi:hypothetical protein [Burkholderia ubonensis]|uniref:hypothetical protein n=1 Tax=Burkholderia ubonensis TaxID=101571 RepID=UPI002FCC1B80